MTSKRLVVVQIVRRFGEVGGMECYVWQLANALVRLDISTIVVCEKVLQPHSEAIQTIQVKASPQRPRWLGLFLFGVRAERVFLKLASKNLSQKFVVHSHERCDFHQITTFHGPPFARILQQPIWKRFSFRVLAHLWLERRELHTPSLKYIVPNSQLTSKSLLTFYPSIHSRLSKAITPGVTFSQPGLNQAVRSDGGVIGFIGKEWKRKGLEFFLSVIDELVKVRPRLEVLILGPEESEIRRLIKGRSFKVEILGWRPSAEVLPYMNLLMHPASMEPYGMVVAEAMASGIPVLVSDQSGVACDVSPAYGSVLSLLDDPQEWAGKADMWLNKVGISPRYQRDWGVVAESYSKLYLAIQ